MATNNEQALRESPMRSILKGITWRILATLTTMIVALAVTGKIDTALKIGGVEVFAKILIYYFHERAWARVPIGTIRRAFGEPSLVRAEATSNTEAPSRPQERS